MKDSRLDISHDKTEEDKIGEEVFVPISHEKETENEENDELEMGM